MNQLTDEQQTLLKFLPDGFEGTKLEKLTMAAFCYCNQSAIERGENHFSLGLIGLKDLTGYNSISKLSIAVKNLISDGYITCLKRGNGIEHLNSVYQMKRESMETERENMGKYGRENMELKRENMRESMEEKRENMEFKRENMKGKIWENMEKGKTNNNNNNNNKNNINFNYSTETNSTVDYTDREKERNNNNTLNSTTDMLDFTERLVLLSKEVESLKSENETLKIEIKTLNERLNKAAKIIKELKESVNTLHTSTDSTKDEGLNEFEIESLKSEFSNQMKVAIDNNANRSERLKAAKTMNSIADKHPDILTENQRKAARNTLSYLNKNTNVESKSETNAEVRGLQDHSFTKESAYTFKEWQESYKAFRVASGNTDVSKEELKEKAQVFIDKSNEVKIHIVSGEVPNKFIAEFKKRTEPQDGLMDFEYDKALRLTEEETQE